MFDRPKPTAGCSAKGRRRIIAIIVRVLTYIYFTFYGTSRKVEARLPMDDQRRKLRFATGDRIVVYNMPPTRPNLEILKHITQYAEENLPLKLKKPGCEPEKGNFFQLLT